MSFKCSFLLRSAYDELLVVGSRWRQLLAKAPPQILNFASTKDNSCVSRVTIIPTLHVASIHFYDRVLEYMQQAVRRDKNTVIFVEGICDSQEAQQAQMREYNEIAQNESLREAMISKADQNNLYTELTMFDICKELSIDYNILLRYISEVRLQECYLKPKMAAYCGSNLHNGADLDMEKVQALLQVEALRLGARGESLPSSVSVTEIGAFPAIRTNRERRVAQMARAQCDRWFQEGIQSEVIIPWGYFHSDAIIRYITQGNGKSGSEAATSDVEVSVSQSNTLKRPAKLGLDLNENPTDTSFSLKTKKDKAATASLDRPALVFVEADELLVKVSFGVPKELIEPINDRNNKAE